MKDKPIKIEHREEWVAVIGNKKRTFDTFIEALSWAEQERNNHGKKETEPVPLREMQR